MENKFVYPTDIIGREHDPAFDFDRVPKKVDWNYLKTKRDFTEEDEQFLTTLFFWRVTVELEESEVVLKFRPVFPTEVPITVTVWAPQNIQDVEDSLLSEALHFDVKQTMAELQPEPDFHQRCLKAVREHANQLNRLALLIYAYRRDKRGKPWVMDSPLRR